MVTKTGYDVDQIYCCFLNCVFFMSSINRNDALTMANLITLVKVLMKIDKKKTKVVRK